MVYFTAISFLCCMLFAGVAKASEDPCVFFHQIERRAAFDIGSGKIKMQISDVDLTAGKITNVLFTDSVKLPMREDLDKNLDGRLSIEMQNKLVDALSELMKKALPFHPKEYHAVATESLRLAKNGKSLTERIKKETGLSMSIITQDEEGILGFVSAINATALDPDKVVSWDFGGGSFQITAKFGDHYLVYQGKLGRKKIFKIYPMNFFKN